MDDPVNTCSVHVHMYYGGVSELCVCVRVCVCVCVRCVQEGGGDYYISGLQMRNRALDRDVVVLQILPPEKWLVRYESSLIVGYTVHCINVFK